jgi:hypothetical protein
MSDPLVEFRASPFLEFTLAVNCPVRCPKYCPQEVFAKEYNGDRKVMPLWAFKNIVSQVPKSVGIHFAGFCEPFAAPEFVDMVKYAHAEGHRIIVASTLYRATWNQVKELASIPFVLFCLHLPYSRETLFPVTRDYMAKAFYVVNSVQRLDFSLMNSLFSSNKRENIARRDLPKPRSLGYCESLVHPQPVVLPDGTAILCCMDFALWHPLGNLLTDGYEEVCRYFYANHRKFALCRYCTHNMPMRTYLRRKLARLLP